jgi:hypothetical protein
LGPYSCQWAVSTSSQYDLNLNCVHANSKLRSPESVSCQRKMHLGGEGSREWIMLARARVFGRSALGTASVLRYSKLQLEDHI